jgi:hypothetical protein
MILIFLGYFTASWVCLGRVFAMSATRLVGNIAVALLAENRLLREALTKILNTKNGIRVVASFPFSPRALKLVAAAGPQVLLLDADTLASSDGQIIQDTHRELPDGERLVREVDLYDLLFQGVRSNAERMEPGDTILIPPGGSPGHGGRHGAASRDL